MNYLGIPFAAIELGLIPLVIIFSRKYCFFSEQDIIRVITIILILSTLSLIFLSTEQFLTIWKVIRSYLLFFFAFFFFYRNDFKEWDRLYQISCISVVFDIISSLLHLNTNVLDGDKEDAFIINILLPLFVISYSYLKKGKLQFLFICVICLLDGFFSITRGNMLYVVITIILSLLILDPKSSIRRIIPMILVSIFVFNVYLSVEDDLEEYSPSMHYRLYTKIINREEANHEGDELRKGHLMYLIEHFDYCVIPHGLPSRESAIVSKKNERLMWSVRDCSLNELVYTYGILGYFAPFLLLVGAIKLYRKKRDDRMNRIFSLCFLVIDAYLFTGYGLLSTPSTVLYLGMIMGSSWRILFYNNVQNNIANINRKTICSL